MVARSALLLIAVCALAACGSSAASSSVTAASSSSATAVARCGPPGARTLAAGAQARVYKTGGAVYACAPGSRPPVRLGTANRCLRAGRVDRTAVSGRLVAAALTRCGVDAGQAAVEVLRLPDGRALYAHGAIGNPGPEAFSTVTDLVLSGRGRVAWIARSSSILRHRTQTEVHAGGPGGTRLLDSGAPVVPGSLRLSGGRVSWQHGSARRSGPLG